MGNIVSGNGHGPSGPPYNIDEMLPFSIPFIVEYIYSILVDYHLYEQNKLFEHDG